MRPDSKLIPLRTKETIDLYVSHGGEPGGFVQAVLENDLMEAIGRADDWNLEALPHIVAYLYNEIPRSCWGSPDAVKKWKSRKRLELKKGD